MACPDGPEVHALRRRVAERLRRDTEHWLAEAMWTGVDPRREYVRMVASLPCHGAACRCALCGGSTCNCNAA